MSNRILYPENKCLKFIGGVIKQKQLNKICKNSLPVDLHNKKCKSPTGRKKSYTMLKFGSIQKRTGERH